MNGIEIVLTTIAVLVILFAVAGYIFIWVYLVPRRLRKERELQELKKKEEEMKELHARFYQAFPCQCPVNSTTQKMTQYGWCVICGRRREP